MSQEHDNDNELCLGMYRPTDEDQGDLEMEIDEDDPEFVALFGRSAQGGDEGKVIEYAPGQFAAIFAGASVPRYGVVRFELVGKQWRPRLVGWGEKISLARFFRKQEVGNKPHPIMQRLGLDLSYNTVLRLFKTNFISGTMPTPNRILIDVASLNRHLIEASDPEFWTEERKRRFREVIY